MKYLKLVLIVLVLGTIGGCSFPLEEGVPESDIVGDYLYTADAVYYDEFGAKLDQKIGSGTLNLNSKFSVFPDQGWTYDLDYQNLVTHVLSDGGKIYTFNIPSQEIEINHISFIIKGKSEFEVKDPNGTVIGKYDGWIDENDKIQFSCESLNLNSRTKTSTGYSALKR